VLTHRLRLIEQDTPSLLFGFVLFTVAGE